MTTYISLLRGINVSGYKLIKMEALRKSYENLGFQNINTYLQSGNVIFTEISSDLKELGQKISLKIEKDFGFEVPVFVLTLDMLKQVIDNNPFIPELNRDPKLMAVTFLSSKPAPADFNTIEDKKQKGEEFFITDNAVYLYYSNGFGKTKLTNNFLETRLKVRATTRNWKTANELLRIAEQTI